jgi:hypothetical protein
MVDPVDDLQALQTNCKGDAQAPLVRGVRATESSTPIGINSSPTQENLRRHALVIQRAMVSTPFSVTTCAADARTRHQEKVARARLGDGGALPRSCGRA